MKRVYLILTLFIASFFFISLNKVSAATHTYEINESDFSYINEEFFDLREKTIEYCQANNKQYIIGLRYGTENLVAHIFSYSMHITNALTNIPKNGFYRSATIFQVVDGKFTEIGTITSYESNFYNTNLEFTYLHYLDTNIENLYNSNSNDSWNFIYKDLTYIINENDKFPTLYEVYVDVYGDPTSPVVPDKFTEEKEMMNNFYSTIFTKISDLATSLANNYTFLTIFGIFILIFVLELIRRYLL